MARSRFLLMFAIILLCSSSGCRRAPSQPTQLYEREREMAIQLATPPAPIYLPNGYPWEGKSKPIDTLPERMNAYEKSVDAELKSFDRAMYGPPKDLYGK